eukprot:1835999-Pleurochrysis_carterae.AAC.1
MRSCALCRLTALHFVKMIPSCGRLHHRRVPSTGAYKIHAYSVSHLALYEMNVSLDDQYSSCISWGPEAAVTF